MVILNWSSPFWNCHLGWRLLADPIILLARVPLRPAPDQWKPQGSPQGNPTLLLKKTPRENYRSGCRENLEEKERIPFKMWGYLIPLKVSCLEYSKFEFKCLRHCLMHRMRIIFSCSKDIIKIQIKRVRKVSAKSRGILQTFEQFYVFLDVQEPIKGILSSLCRSSAVVYINSINIFVNKKISWMTISLSVFWFRFLIFSGEEKVGGLFKAESALSLPPAT